MRLAIVAGALALAAVVASACASHRDATASGGPICTTQAAGPKGTASGLALAPFCKPSDPGGGGILFTASGEALALTGYDFPPVSADAPAFVDGWEVRFTRLLATIDRITLAANPDKNPGDESQTDGVVAEVDGPWAVDLSHGDRSYLPGKGGPGEEAVPIAALATQNRDGDSAFDTSGTPYAFGFDTIAATPKAQNVNLDGAALDDYAAMIADGCSVLYVGTATFKGDKTNPECYPPQNQGWPDVVGFRLCFKSPTSYVNCQNPDVGGDPFADEEHPRGILLKSGSSVIGQITLHTDHPFWDSVLHDSPMHFDQFAARVIAGAGDAGAVPTVTLEMTRGVDYTAYTDALGRLLDWRYCIEPPTDVHPKLTGFMRFDRQDVPPSSDGSPASGLRDYADFSTYDQSTQGHLNSDGLCYVKRNFPSPP